MRVAVAQMEPKLAEKERNLDACLARLEEAAAAGAELLVLPGVRDPRATCSTAPRRRSRSRRRFPGPSTEAFERECRGSASTSSAGCSSATATRSATPPSSSGPDGLIGTYRKTHLPFLGVDRFVTPGDELQVFDTPLGRIGLEICYDLRFPEVTRTLALQGADIVAHPTNFPVAAQDRRPS